MKRLSTAFVGAFAPAPRLPKTVGLDATLLQQQMLDALIHANRAALEAKGEAPAYVSIDARGGFSCPRCRSWQRFAGATPKGHAACTSCKRMLRIAN